MKLAVDQVLYGLATARSVVCYNQLSACPYFS